jgi:DNA-binding NarL/FixJ family response regulator
MSALLDQDEAIEIVDEDALERLDVQERARVVIVGDAVEPALLSRLRSLRPVVRIVVFARDPIWAYGVVLLAVGMTCVDSRATTGELLAVVHLAARGEAVFVFATDQGIQRRYPAEVPSLTPRELEVLVHLSQGTMHAAIALALNISVRTVQSYAAAVCRKLGLEKTRELVGIPVIPVEGDDTRTASWGPHLLRISGPFYG